MSRKAKNKLARKRRFYQEQAPKRKAALERAYQSYREERERMGFSVDIVTDTPSDLKDVTPVGTKGIQLLP